MSGQHSLGSVIEKQGFAVLDGAMATELERKGADLNHVLWSAKLLLTSPQMIQRVHLEYLWAGADILLTSGYQASFEGFLQIGLEEEKTIELLNLSVDLALQARQSFWDEAGGSGRPYPIVAASLGPYGAILADGSEYSGDYGCSVEMLTTFHRSRIAVLAKAGADLLAFETIPSLFEAKAILQALKNWPELPVWLSFSCKDEAHTCYGELLADCVRFLEPFTQVVGIGINCTAPAFVKPLLRSIRPLSQKILIVYPNSGEQWDAASHCWRKGVEEHDFGKLTLTWQSAGAQVIGGCCRTGPEDVKKIRAALTSAFQ